MYKIALILSYFGSFPNYFSLWLHSAGMNDTIDFYVLTDNKDTFPHAENIHFVSCTLSGLQEHFSRFLGYNVALDTPYKLCDYKPALGLMFADILKNYDFWGYCDPDIIWGNLRNFITDEVLETHDKIFELGHLTIFRNTERINKLFLDWKAPITRSFYETSHTRDHVGFDEMGGLIPLNRMQAREGKLRIYNKIDIIGDIWYEETRFNSAWCKAADTPHIYEYRQGQLHALIADRNTVTRKPVMYVHLQKRPMKTETERGDHFLIKPNQFIPPCEVTADMIRRFNQDTTPVYIGSHRSMQHRVSLRNIFYKTVLRHCRQLCFHTSRRAQGIEMSNLHRALAQEL